MSRWPALIVALVAFGFAAPACAKYDVDIDAPRSIKKLLKENLDLSRFAKRDDVSDDQFQFLVTATPKDVRDLVATEGYFTPIVRTDVTTVDDKRNVKVSVDPGPRTMVASVQLNFTGAVTTEDRAQENAARFAFRSAKAILSRKAAGTTRKTPRCGPCNRNAISARRSCVRRRASIRARIWPISP